MNKTDLVNASLVVTTALNVVKYWSLSKGSKGIEQALYLQIVTSTIMLTSGFWVVDVDPNLWGFIILQPLNVWAILTGIRGLLNERRR